MLKSYEETVIIDGALDNDQVNVEVKKIEDLIRAHQGNIIEVNRWGRRRMAYPIRKKAQGFYVIFRFEAEGQFIVELEHELGLNETIMRYLTIAVEEEMAAAEKEKAEADPPSEQAEQEEEKEPSL